MSFPVRTLVYGALIKDGRADIEQILGGLETVSSFQKKNFVKNGVDYFGFSTLNGRIYVFSDEPAHGNDILNADDLQVIAYVPRGSDNDDVRHFGPGFSLEQDALLPNDEPSGSVPVARLFHQPENGFVYIAKSTNDVLRLNKEAKLDKGVSVAKLVDLVETHYTNPDQKYMLP
jgi:hypothetical protein